MARLNRINGKSIRGYLKPLTAILLTLGMLSITTRYSPQIRSGGLVVQLLATVLVVVCCAVLLVWCLGPERARYALVKCAAGLRHIPKPVLGFLAAVVLFQAVCLTIAADIYPFTAVGMFRGPNPLPQLNPEVEVPKFYYTERGSGKPIVVDLRREHIPFLKRFPNVKADQLYSVRPYDNMGKEQNYKYLKQLMAPYTDSLRLGVHHYNFRTGLDTFYTDREVVAQKLEKYAKTHRLFIP